MWRHWRWSREAKTLGEKWRRDYPWPLRGTSGEAGRRLAYHAAGLLLVAAFLGLFHFLMWREWQSPDSIHGFIWIFIGALALFDVILAASLVFFLYRLMQWFRFGRAEILFQGAPFPPGGELRVLFQGSPNLAGAEKTEAALRHVREQMVRRGEDSAHEALMLYEDRKPLRLDSRGAAEISFMLPPDAPETNLGNPADFTRYWEVVVTARMPGVDYEGVFLVPVYKAD
jgi:hypothetical protein